MIVEQHAKCASAAGFLKVQMQLEQDQAAKEGQQAKLGAATAELELLREEHAQLQVRQITHPTVHSTSCSTCTVTCVYHNCCTNVRMCCDEIALE